jgi:microcystin-dependent protein
MQYGGSSAPLTGGWLLCDGSEYAEAAYAALFTAISTTYNTGGETADYFRVPDLRGRVPVGVDGSAGRVAANDALGESSGSETHSLTEAELAAHTHALTLVDGGGSSSANPKKSTESSTTAGATASAGSGTAHNNMQPYLVVQYIIKT